MSELSYGEARDVAQSPTEAIALGLVLLDRIAEALENLVAQGEGDEWVDAQ